MCLTTVSSGFVKYRIRVGYKQMVKTSKHGIPYYSGPYFDKPKMITGIMYTANVSINDDADRSYVNGFHIFKKKTDAKKWSSDKSNCLVKVYYRHILAEGKQDGSDVVVALQMMVVEDLGDI